MRAAADPAAERDALADDRPIALRRKRRASSALASSPVKPAQPAGDAASALRSALLPEARTPRSKKRVRFSYPPDAPSASSPARGPESTGITPFVARTTLLEPQPARPARLLRQPARRRRSAPGPGGAGGESLQLSSRSVEVQFAPIRQILSERTRRRLGRSHLSETMNDLEAEQRHQRAQETELGRFRREVDHLRAGNPGLASEEHVQGLEGEIRRLKEQLAASGSRLLSYSSSGSRPDAPMTTDCLASDAGSEDVMLVDGACGASTPVTPTTPASCGSATSAPDTPCTSASVQTDFTARAVDKLHAHFDSQVKVLCDARLELERIMPGETPLPLSSPTENVGLWKATPSPSQGLLGGAAQNVILADAAPLLNAVLRHVRAMKTRITQTTKDLSTSEAQRANVVGNFRTALKQLNEARQERAKLIAASQTRPKASSSVDDKRSAESRRITDEDVRTCELEEATTKLKELQENAATYERDRASLVSALNKYREEIKDMEALVGTLETEHSLSMQDLKGANSQKLERLVAEHAHAVGDLEARVSAETRAREEAEAQIDKVIVRWADQREKGEREVGLLNVKLADLDEEVKLRDHEVESLRQELAALQEHVRHFVGNIGADFNSAGFGDEPQTPTEEPSLPDHHPVASKQSSRVGKWGLLTPHVEGGRFRNVPGGMSPELSSDASVGGDSVPGEVEMGRGKRRTASNRHDSGIGIVVEDEDEG